MPLSTLRLLWVIPAIMSAHVSSSYLPLISLMVFFNALYFAPMSLWWHTHTYKLLMPLPLVPFRSYAVPFPVWLCQASFPIGWPMAPNSRLNSTANHCNSSLTSYYWVANSTQLNSHRSNTKVDRFHIRRRHMTNCDFSWHLDCKAISTRKLLFMIFSLAQKDGLWHLK